jgi:hypothetical protein
MQNKNKLDSAILHERDFDFEYFGFKTLERSYLLKINGEVAETPQHMYMRVAAGIWGDDMKNVIKTYELLSNHMMTHATPTLFNSGTKKPQLSSCFLLMMDDDSIPGIYKTLSDVAVISQNAGGIGLAIHNIRSTGSYIKGTNGNSNGIIPMLRVFNETARYVDQCFIGETLIRVSGGDKKIEEIEAGDLVLSSDGEYHLVEEKIVTRSSDKIMVEIETDGGKNIVTEDHLFLCIKGGNLIENIEIKFESGTINPEWVEAKNITGEDILLSF